MTEGPPEEPTAAPAPAAAPAAHAPSPAAPSAASPSPAPPAPSPAPASPPHGPAPTRGPEGRDEDGLERARRMLREAILRKPPIQATPRPLPANLRVDKYFGERLPPVCAELGCYLTDDGKRFYCVNAACQKHKKRVTKHTRRGSKPAAPRLVYFRCPRCDSRNIEMHLLSNKYVCRACRYNWDR